LKRATRRPAAPRNQPAPLDAAAEAAVRTFLKGRAGAPAAARIEAMAGDASTRRYFRVHDQDGSTVVALYPEPFDAATAPFVVMHGLLAGWGVPVPRILEADGARGVVWLEDLGDETLQTSIAGVDANGLRDLYRQALDQLVRLQGEAAQGRQGASCFHIAFDFEKLSWELHFFWKHFLEAFRGADLSVEDRASVADGFHRLASEIASWPRVLCHRDFHSRNLMAHDGRLVWIDFQDARMGPATYDLASLLRDSYVDLPEEFVAERVEEFRQRAVPGESRDTFQRRFELMSIQRNLKALGTFGYMSTSRGSGVYLPYVPRTLANARRNLVRHPELSGLHRALARHLEELR
jgi:N-acetylmuramate 1-kinase